MQIKMNDYNQKDVLRVLREWNELTQKDYAKLVNKSYGAIVKYENGQRDMALSTFINICKGSGVEIILKKR